MNIFHILSSTCFYDEKMKLERALAEAGRDEDERHLILCGFVEGFSVAREVLLRRVGENICAEEKGDDDAE